MDTTHRLLRILGVDGDTVDVAHLARKFALAIADVEAVVERHGPSRSAVEIFLFDLRSSSLRALPIDDAL